jgi:hypothetical protein
MVAIDTPYLMEEDGKFNEDKNEVSLVTHFLELNIEAIKIHAKSYQEWSRENESNNK